MEEKQIGNKRQIVYNKFDKKTILTILIVLITCISLPSKVKCDMGDTTASLILFIIISVFVCAGIGWWSRRGESSK
jgi:hypothetical protein